MSSKPVKTFIALVGAIFFSAAIVLADKGKSVTVYYDTVLPNGQELKAGGYVIHMSKTNDAVQFVQKGKVIAEAPCKCIKHEKKNENTEMIFKETSEGKQLLQELRLRGDTKTIVLEAQGM